MPAQYCDICAQQIHPHWPISWALLLLGTIVHHQDNVVLSPYLLAQPGKGYSHQQIPQRWWSSLSPRSHCSDWDLRRQDETPHHLSVLFHQRWHLLKRREAEKKKETLTQMSLETQILWYSYTAGKATFRKYRGLFPRWSSFRATRIWLGLDYLCDTVR